MAGFRPHRRVSETSVRRQSGVIETLNRVTKHPVNRLGSKASLGEESLLTCSLGRILRGDAEAASPSLEGAFALGGAQASQNRIADLRVESMHLQLLLDSPKAETLGSSSREAFCESLLAQPAFLLKAIENRGELLG